MSVAKVRFDDVDFAAGYAYHGYYLTYEEPEYRLAARLYDDEPEQVTIYSSDIPQSGTEDLPDADDRFLRAAIALAEAVGARRVVVLDFVGAQGIRRETAVDLRRLQREDQR